MTAFFTTEDELRLARELAFAIGQSKTEREALQIALTQVCRATGWCLGQAWTPHEDVLECSDAWFCEDTIREDIAEFRRCSVNFQFARGIGLPGRVWKSGRAAWSTDVSIDPNFPRKNFAHAAGLHAGFAIPVTADGEVVTILEFFVFETRPADARLIDAISSVLIPLGSLIVHKRAEEALRESEAELQALVNALDDLVLVLSNEGRFLKISPLDSKLLYHPAPELLGHTLQEKFPPAEAESFLRVVQSALTAQKTVNIEYSLPIGEETMWFSANVSPLTGISSGVPRVVWVARDITKRKNAEVQLVQAEENYRGIFEHAIEGIFQTDKEGYYLRANPALARIYGYETPAEMMTQLTDIAHQLYVDENRRNDFAQLLAIHNAVTKFESQVRRKDGGIIWISENARAVRNSDNEILYYEGSVEDITERKWRETQISDQQVKLQEINVQLQALATLDGLTGLKNHRAMQEKFDLECARALADHRPLSFLLLDVDKFKSYNDSFGHPAGDFVLKQLAMVLNQNARGTDFVARYGGEEFAVILPGAGRKGALISAERFRRSIEKAHWPERTITASFGVATFEPGTVPRREDGTPDLKDNELPCPTLFSDADRALYWSKTSGRNRTTHADDLPK